MWRYRLRVVPDTAIRRKFAFNVDLQRAIVFVSDQRNGPYVVPSRLEDIAGRKFLLVPDDCGLSDTVRVLFRDAKLASDEYEGRALGYQVLEKWARMGIGVTLLPASHVTDTAFARPFKTNGGSIALIEFEAQWTPGQEVRKSFKTVMSCLSSFQSPNAAEILTA